LLLNSKYNPNQKKKHVEEERSETGEADYNSHAYILTWLAGNVKQKHVYF
tara:strand:- start:948 stop:1097 length:150 start_codon:yes stop_codon:yes gene_type:complete